MRILFINSIGKNKWGGGEKWMVNAAKGLAERSHKVILACKNNSVLMKNAIKKNINTIGINIHSDLNFFKSFQIAKFLKKEKIEVLICNLNKDVRVAGLGGRIAKIPLILARHGILLCSKKLKHKLALTKLIDGIITNSITIKNKYIEYKWFNNNFVKIIYNGLKIPHMTPDFDYGKCFPEARGKKVILSAGRLSTQKGFEYLIEVAELAKQKQKNWMIFIAGEGKLYNRLFNKIKRNKLTGYIKMIGFYENIFPLLKSCELFVLPSLFEGMPNVVMEAMAMGKAIVSTDVNGARELIKENETGFIVPPKNSLILYNKIEILLENQKLRDKMGKAGKERVKKHFTYNRMIDNLENYLKEKLKK